MTDNTTTEQPDSVEDQVANEKFSSLIIRLMQVPGIKQTADEFKSGHGVPVKYFDDKRYSGQERTMHIDSRMTPSVLRFISLCQALASGFRAAYKPPIDLDLARTHWLPACLELMTEPILKSPANDWKTTLTLVDAANIKEYFVKAIREILCWMDSVRMTEPNAAPENWGGLVETIHNVFVVPYLVNDGGRPGVNVPADIILRVNESGNLQIEDRPLFAVLSACAEQGTAAIYREGDCPTECKGQLAVGNLALEYDHDSLCEDCIGRIKMTHDYLAKRFQIYLEATDAATRRAALALEADRNRWYTYYVDEYCVPTAYHLKRCDKEKFNVETVHDWMAQMDKLSAAVCDAVLLDSGRSEAATIMHNAWRDIRATFSLRNIGGAMPSYAEQEKFAYALSDFMHLFADAVKTINNGRASEMAQRTTKADGSAPSCADAPSSASKKETLGDYARNKVVHSVDFDNREVTFKGNKAGQPGRTLKCPKESDAPWKYLVRMLTSTDKDGWVGLTTDEAESFRPQFLRSKKDRNGNRRDGDKILREFYQHIESFKGAGKRGTAKIRLVRRARKIKTPRKKVSSVSAI